MTTLYQFSCNRYDRQFAQATRLGTWSPQPTPAMCPECTRSLQTRIRPLIITWEPSSDLIGDFTWPGLLDDMIVTDRVKQCLEGKVRGVEFSPIVVKGTPLPSRGKKGRASPSSTEVRENLLPLWDMWINAQCRLDHLASSIEVKKQCGTCNHVFYFSNQNWEGLVVSSESWHGENVFRCVETPVWNYALQDIRDAIVLGGFTNVTLLERGTVPTGQEDPAGSPTD